MIGRTALHFAAEAGDPSRMVGRQVANAGFVSAYLAHGKEGAVPIHATPSDFERFKEAFPTDRSLTHIPSHQPRKLADFGGLFMPGPALAKRAWHRRLIGRGRYSLTGVTHAMASSRAHEAVREMLVAPMASWDALICASEPIRKLIVSLADNYADALSDIVGRKPGFLPQLPVIPLGVDAGSLSAIDPVAGKKFRESQKISSDSFVVLFLGRLSYHTKAHPTPFYRALEMVAARIGRPVTLIEAGWYYNPETEAAFQAAAESFAPRVQLVKADARDPSIKEAALAASNVFVSLVDNVQESFGLTPVEAMAAGLPSVVSDWDGYRDTVVHGETGFLIPTLMPPSGAGYEYAWRLASEQDDYDVHVGVVAQHVAVDIPKTVEALQALAAGPDMARAMGEAARLRAQQTYDWPVIVRAYDALWQEQEERRAFHANEEPKPVPQVADPFRTFAGFASETISQGFSVHPVDDAEILLDRLAASPISAMDRRSLEDGRALVASMRQQGAVIMREQLTETAVIEGARGLRALVWLLKMGVVERI